MLHQSNKPVRVCDACFTEKTDHLNRFRQNRTSQPEVESRQSILEQEAAGTLEKATSEPSQTTDRPKSLVLQEDGCVELIDTEKELCSSQEDVILGETQSEDLSSDSEDELEGAILKTTAISLEDSQVRF
jgi:hypothetical protein